MQGLNNFMSKIGVYLQKGLMDWLFGALAGAGLQLPDKFDLQGIISIVLQILGLTYANFRARAVAIVGEPVVAAIEKTAEVFKVIITEGVPGLWRFIKEQLARPQVHGDRRHFRLYQRTSDHGGHHLDHRSAQPGIRIL